MGRSSATDDDMIPETMSRAALIDQAHYHLDRCGCGADTGSDHQSLAAYLERLGAPEQTVETARRFGHDEAVFALYGGPERNGYGPGRRIVADWLRDQLRALNSQSIGDQLSDGGAA